MSNSVAAFQNNQNLLEVEAKPSITEISFKDFSKNAFATRKFKQLKKNRLNQMLQRGDVATSAFVIDTTSISFIESPDKTYHSYTFLVEDNEENNGLDNVFFSLMLDGSYKTFLAHYDISDDEINQLSVGETLNITDKWSFTEINPNQVVNSDARVYFNGATGCWERETFYEGQLCNRAGHTYQQYLSSGCEAPIKPTRDFIVVSTITCSTIAGQGTDPQGGGFNHDNSNSGGPRGHTSTPKVKQEVPPNTLMVGECVDSQQVTDIIDKLGLPNTTTIRDCLESSDNCESVANLHNYLENNKKGPNVNAALLFGNQAASAICNGGEVDFEDKVILDSTFLANAKISCVYEKLSNQMGTLFKDITSNYFGGINNNHVKITIGSIPAQLGTATQAYTYTDYDNSDIATKPGAIKHIRIDPVFVSSASSLELAQFLIHELVHAELLDRCIKLGLIKKASPLGVVVFVSSPTVDTITGVLFNQMLVKYNAYSSGGVSGNPQWNHNLFNALSYRDEMTQNLISIHPLLNDASNDFLTNVNNDPVRVGGPYSLSQLMNYVTWIGLENTQEYITNISSNPIKLAKKVYVEGVTNSMYTNTCN